MKKNKENKEKRRKTWVIAIHPIKEVQTNLISPSLLSIQYWFSPWLWHVHRPTGLYRLSSLPGLLGKKIVSDFKIFIGVTGTG